MIMGSSLRRLWIYYSNNVRRTHIMGLVACIAFILWLFGPYFRGDESVVKSKYGVVRYKKVVEPERMSAEDIQKTLDSLVDTRPYQCRGHKYDFNRLETGESVSIIIDFHGSSFYSLKLTLSSIVEYTPYDLYTEIVVLDDGTTDENIRQQVSKFLQDARFNKVKIYRSDAYAGQSASWFKSSLVAVGQLLVFVDSSVVVNQGWLQPLISQLLEEEKLIAVPHADNILDDNRFFRTDDSLVNVVTWSLSTIHFDAPASSSDTTGETLDTPVARGDVIAVRRSFLESIGGIDDGLLEDSGNGQHVELSLRAWLCGGAVRIVTCSHVAVRNALRQRRVSNARNYRRITELWLDDYKNIVYRQGGYASRSQPDVVLSSQESESLLIRRSGIRKSKYASQCHPFSWYLANVATSIVAPSDSMQHFGKLRAKTNYCVRTSSTSRGVVEMDLCREYLYEPEAIFEMSSDGSIFRGDLCLVPNKSGRVIAKPCDNEDPDQKWTWLSDSRLGVHTKPGLCLAQISERNPDTMELYHFAQLQKCSEPDDDRRKETWKFISY